MTAPERWLTSDELLITDGDLANALNGGQWPGGPYGAIQVRPLGQGLAAVLIPRGLTCVQENRLRAAFGVPPRPANRRRSS